jgi:lactate dehydrogenase-like 2-hydroxyacid dehydrogenase
MSDPRPLVVMSDPVLAAMAPILSATYRVRRLWEEDSALLLADAGAEIAAIVHTGDVVLERDFIEAMPNLGLIACVSVGYDGVDVPHARARGIEVTHAPGLNAEDVADHALGLIIAAWRGIVEGDALVRAGAWGRGQERAPCGSLTGKTVGIVGLGRIGEGVARRAAACGMKPLWWGPRDKPDAAWPRVESVLALAEASDILVVAARPDATNRGLIDRAVLNALGPRGLVVNVARGSLVDEDALIAALKEGRLGMAALDVFQTEPTPGERWAGVPNVIFTPHSAGKAAETLMKLVVQTLENLRLHFAGEPVLSPVPR